MSDEVNQEHSITHPIFEHVLGDNTFYLSLLGRNVPVYLPLVHLQRWSVESLPAIVDAHLAHDPVTPPVITET